MRYIFTVTVAPTFLISCNQNSNKAQSVPNKQEISARENSILSYSDSINRTLPTFLKHESLFYYLGDNSFYVTKYHDINHTNVVFVKHNHIGKQKIIEQSYYIRNGQTVLELTTEKNKQSKPAEIIKQYFYNQAGWIPQGEKQNDGYNSNLFTNDNAAPSPTNWTREINTMEDALNQRGNFELVFEGITEYPKAKYIMLSQDKVNTYRAPIKIEKEDELVTELRLNPERFRGRKLLITCTVRNKDEAVYVSGKLK